MREFKELFFNVISIGGQVTQPQTFRNIVDDAFSEGAAGGAHGLLSAERFSEWFTQNELAVQLRQALRGAGCRKLLPRRDFFSRLSCFRSSKNIAKKRKCVSVCMFVLFSSY